MPCVISVLSGLASLVGGFDGLLNVVQSLVREAVLQILDGLAAETVGAFLEGAVFVPLVLRQLNLGFLEIHDGIGHLLGTAFGEFLGLGEMLESSIDVPCFGYSGSLGDFDLDLSAPAAQVTTMRSTLTARVKIRFMA
jgi:hypothetical protein